jgi:GR25 family glycosyltransferase involved in LPS biosynthesis
MINYENFIETVDDDISYNVIHIKKDNELRYNQILEMENKLGRKINFFDGIHGKNTDIKKLDIFDKNITFNFNYRYIGEVGCYLSHFMLIKQCINSPCKYSVIFEDDFVISDPNFHNNLKSTLDKINIDFDMLYLGNITENRGEKLIDNIYYPDKNQQILGTHGYLIKNSNASKILKALYNINMPIDHKFRTEFLKNNINVLMLYPSIVVANNTIGSLIHP